MAVKYICPECKKPYTPTSKPAFPKHGRHWVNTPGGGGWKYCPGYGMPVTEFTEKHIPKSPGKRAQ